MDGRPNKKFQKNGSVTNPHLNQVFLVFINDESVAYHWR